MRPPSATLGKARIILLHVAGWLVFFVTPLLLSPPGEIESAFKDPSGLESLAIRNLILMGLFYFNYFYLTPHVLKPKGVTIFLLILLPTILLVSSVNWQIHHALAEPGGPPMMMGGGPPPGPPDGFDRGPGHGPGAPGGPGGPGRPGGPGFGRPRPMMLASSLFASLLITLIVASIGTSLVLWQDVAKAKLEEQERALQRVASELAVLKLQISPHFLFNTLNNIRWLVRSKADTAEEAVLKLSKLLRYVLYQTNEEKVPLERELDNLRDYVELQQLRLPEAGSFSLDIKGDPGKSTVVPLLLLPLAENLFKYGDFSTSFVNRFEISITPHRLEVKAINRIASRKEDGKKEASGIGLTNIRKRLTLHYPDRHEFTHGEKDGIFEVTLGIIMS